jgi:hypothetical protein
MFGSFVTEYQTYNHATGAAGVKTAVLRKGPAGLDIIRAAAHRRRNAPLASLSQLKNFPLTFYFLAPIIGL